MHLSWLDPHKMRKMTVVGTEKMVVFDDMEPERKVTVYENAPEERDGAWGALAGEVSSPSVPLDEPLRLECEHFLALVRGEGDRRGVARDGAMVVRALERLTESLRGS
jgi:predicted dehydrogenase